MILQGDCIERMKELEDNSIDAVITDPPYELGFMGKHWDASGIAYNLDMWKQVFRILKPGGHLLSFSGTRTYHRMASAIEDAGFEVRDMIEWVYGSGFPKSLNIGKAVDKLQGNEREEMGYREDFVKRVRKNGVESKDYIMAGGWKADPTQVGRLTKGTSEWEGWGTALKPAHESICLAQKRFDSRSVIDYTKDIISKIILCLSQSSAKIAEKNLELSHQEQSVDASIVQWPVEKAINTPEDLQEAMGILRSSTMENTSLSIVLSWLNTLAEIWKIENTSTTKTETSLITELEILKSLEWESILQNIIEQKNNKTDGLSADAYNAGILLNAVKLKLNYIREHFAQDTATDLVKNKVSRPNHEPICMARKPLSEKTVAENCLKWGTGGINIDESRVETEDNLNGGAYSRGEYDTDGKVLELGLKRQEGKYEQPSGRFPANLIHDNSEEVRECFPETKSNIKAQSKGSWSGSFTSESDKRGEYKGYDLGGNCARFFKSIIYTAKASKSERNRGCEGLEEKNPAVFDFRPTLETARENWATPIDETPYGRGGKMQNNHPTVKPIALMEYLVNMVTKKDALILDPFAGSGSTLIAAKNLGRRYIGIEQEPEYVKIAEARLASVKDTLL